MNRPAYEQAGSQANAGFDGHQEGTQASDLLRNVKLGIRTQRVERVIVEHDWFKAI